MLEIERLSFSYGDHRVLNNIDLRAEYGQLVSILGSNGAGKSTLFKCVLGILPHYTGTVTVDGKNTVDISIRELARKMAYVPQMSVSVFNYRVEEIVLMGTTAGLPALRSPDRAQIRKAEEAMERMGISALRKRFFHYLSGGERQLVILARALAQQANILLLDEPSSALDFGNQMRILNEVRGLTREGYLVIQSTHDPEKAYMFSDRIIALKNGEVIARGRPDEVLTEGNILRLYGIRTELTSILNDRVRVFTPKDIL